MGLLWKHALKRERDVPGRDRDKVKSRGVVSLLLFPVVDEGQAVR